MKLTRSNTSSVELPTLDEVREERARRRLTRFTEIVAPEITPAPHHLLLAEKLEAVERGDCRRLMIFMPPGHGKSWWGSVWFPAWFLGRHPTRKLITASHTADLATTFGRRVRNLVRSEEYRGIFDVALSADTQAAGHWETDQAGELLSVGVSGAIAGRRANLVVIDDPIKGHEAADSLRERNKLWEWYLTELRLRLTRDAAIILIQTRWHDDDLAARILGTQYKSGSSLVEVSGEVWDVLSLPALAEADDALGRAEGEPLWPEWFGKGYYDTERRIQTPRAWSALFQQRPTPETGDYFKREMLRWYDRAPARDTLQIYGASDYAVTADGGDWTVHAVIGVDPSDDIYVLDWWRGQTDSDVWVEMLLNLMQRWKPREWYEEKGQIIKSVGPFIHKRMRESSIHCYRKQFSSSHDKPTRAQSWRARMSMGMVYLPRNAPWVEGLVSELLTFPTGVNDDQVDVLSLFGRGLPRLSKGLLPPPPKPEIVGVEGANMERLFEDREKLIGEDRW